MEELTKCKITKTIQRKKQTKTFNKLLDRSPLVVTVFHDEIKKS